MEANVSAFSDGDYVLTESDMRKDFGWNEMSPLVAIRILEEDEGCTLHRVLTPPPGTRVGLPRTCFRGFGGGWNFIFGLKTI